MQVDAQKQDTALVKGLLQADPPALLCRFQLLLEVESPKPVV